MKPGDVLENSIWMNGDETAEMRARYKSDVEMLMEETRVHAGFVLGPVTWSVKRPGEDRVPPVPDHIQGPDVTLLVGEAPIYAVEPPQGHFVTDELEKSDLMKLRKATRKAYRKQYPGRITLSDAQCDTVINDLGPEVAMEELRRGTMH